MRSAHVAHALAAGLILQFVASHALGQQQAQSPRQTEQHERGEQSGQAEQDGVASDELLSVPVTGLTIGGAPASPSIANPIANDPEARAQAGGCSMR